MADDNLTEEFPLELFGGGTNAAVEEEFPLDLFTEKPNVPEGFWEPVLPPELAGSEPPEVAFGGAGLIPPANVPEPVGTRLAIPPLPAEKPFDLLSESDLTFPPPRPTVPEELTRVPEPTVRNLLGNLVGTDMNVVSRAISPTMPVTPPLPTTFSEAMQPEIRPPEGVIKGPEIPDFTEVGYEEFRKNLEQQKLTLPKAEITDEDSASAVAAKEFWNIASSVPEFFSSQLGVMAFLSGVAALAATAGVFTGTLLKDLTRQVMDIIPEWNKLSTNQKTRAVVDVLGTGLLTFGAFKGATRGRLAPERGAIRAVEGPEAEPFKIYEKTRPPEGVLPGSPAAEGVIQPASLFTQPPVVRTPLGMVPRVAPVPAQFQFQPPAERPEETISRTAPLATRAELAEPVVRPPGTGMGGELITPPMGARAGVMPTTTLPLRGADAVTYNTLRNEGISHDNAVKLMNKSISAEDAVNAHIDAFANAGVPYYDAIERVNGILKEFDARKTAAKAPALQPAPAPLPTPAPAAKPAAVEGVPAGGRELTESDVRGQDAYKKLDQIFQTAKWKEPGRKRAISKLADQALDAGAINADGHAAIKEALKDRSLTSEQMADVFRKQVVAKIRGDRFSAQPPFREPPPAPKKKGKEKAEAAPTPEPAALDSDDPFRILETSHDPNQISEALVKITGGHTQDFIPNVVNNMRIALAQSFVPDLKRMRDKGVAVGKDVEYNGKKYNLLRFEIDDSKSDVESQLRAVLYKDDAMKAVSAFRLNPVKTETVIAPATAPTPAPVTPVPAAAPAPAAKPATKFGIPIEQYDEMLKYNDAEQMAKWGTTIDEIKAQWESAGKPQGPALGPTPRQTAVSRPQNVAQLRQQFIDANQGRVTPEQADALVSLVEGIAKYKGLTPDEYVQQKFGGVTAGGEPSADALWKTWAEKNPAESERLNEYLQEAHLGQDTDNYVDQITSFLTDIAKRPVGTSAIRPNIKTLMAVDISGNCPLRENGTPCLFCYVEVPRTMEQVGIPRPLSANKVFDHAAYNSADVLNMPDELVNYLNKKVGGLRVFSTGDFKASDVATLDKIVSDAGKKGLFLKVITKQPEMLERYRNEKHVVFNLSSELAPENAKEIVSTAVNRMIEDGVDPVSALKSGIKLEALLKDRAARRLVAYGWDIAEAKKSIANNPRATVRYVAMNRADAIKAITDPRIGVVTMYHGINRPDLMMRVWRKQNPYIFDQLGENTVKALASIFQSPKVSKFAGTVTEAELRSVLKDRPMTLSQFEKLAARKFCCQTGRCSNCVVGCGFKQGEGIRILGKMLDGEKLASVEFDTDSRAVIRAFEKSNVAAMAHELGHTFRRDLKTEDLDVVENWVGVKDGKWRVEHEEKWANGFERYLREGKAPNSSLAKVFDQFKQWLTNIYSKIKGSSIDVKLTPEVRRVMDKLLGKETEKSLVSQPAPLGPGPGAKLATDPFDPLGSDLAQLTEALRLQIEAATAAGTRISPKVPLRDKIRNALDIYGRWGRGRNMVARTFGRATAIGEALWQNWRHLPEWRDFETSVGRWTGTDQMTSLEARRWIKLLNSKEGVPDPKRQEAITNWIQADGNDVLLQYRARTAPYAYRLGYELALRLSPDEISLARNLSSYFDAKLQKAIEEGMMKQGLENYITQVWDRPTDATQKMWSDLFGSGNLDPTFKFARKRIFDSFWDGETQGFKPKFKEAGKLVAVYDLTFNRALSARTFIKELHEGTAKDGMPIALIEGMGSEVPKDTTPPASPTAYLINPHIAPNTQLKLLRLEGLSHTDAINLINGSLTPFQAAGILKPGASAIRLSWTQDRLESILRSHGAITPDGRKYVRVDHWALRDWKWVNKVPSGQEIIMHGDMVIHPDYARQLKNMLAKSKLRQAPVAKQILTFGAFAKQTKLSVSPFHTVQEGIHAMAHRVDPTGKIKTLLPIDLTDANQKLLVDHGLMVSDVRASDLFSEGLTGGGLVGKIPGIGRLQQWYTDVTFQSFIPRLKMTMAVDALERNRNAYSKQIAAGKVTDSQIVALTARESNAAFGEQNYRMMGRSPTVQDFLRMSLLAPDFLEARFRFIGQALKPYGREQRIALFWMGTFMYMGARMFNKMLDDEYHWLDKPFTVISGGREYHLRTLMGDAVHLVTDPRSFWYNRFSPVSRTFVEMATSRDDRGIKRTSVEQFQDFLKWFVPIPLQFRPGEKLLQTGLAATGLPSRMETKEQEVYKLVDKWAARQRDPRIIETYKRRSQETLVLSPYAPLRVALRGGNYKLARKAFKDLIATGHDPLRINQTMQNDRRTFTGNKQWELMFYHSLTPEERKIYRAAARERLLVGARWRKLAGTPAIEMED